MIKKTNHIKYKQEGFTFIEVLVVSSVIALLSTIGLSGFQSITRSGRDALRKTDLEAIRSAMEIYKSENDMYPASDGSCGITGLNPDYIATVPSDPKSPYNYCYVRDSNLIYRLCAHLENGDTSDYCDAGTLCGGVCNWQVSNP